MYLVAMVMTGAPVGTPGKGPLDPAMSMWEYGSGAVESTPCCIGVCGGEKKNLSTERTKLIYISYFDNVFPPCQVLRP